ncbi:MAG: signal peptidase II [Lachnospiraceae bacterium]|nr:signal peptidase II [Lachnospiraceae bacterium]
MNNNTKRFTLSLILLAVLTLIDRITKIWATDRLYDSDPIEIIPNILMLYYLPNGNTGAAFGMLSGHRVLFLAIAIVVVAAIIYLIYNMPPDRKYRIIGILLVFIAAGGAGNMIDRFIQGYVVDFIYISIINFPIFNVADMYVSICTVLLAIIVLFKLKDDDYEKLETAFLAPFKKKGVEKDGE